MFHEVADVPVRSRLSLGLERFIAAVVGDKSLWITVWLLLSGNLRHTESIPFMSITAITFNCRLTETITHVRYMFTFMRKACDWLTIWDSLSYWLFAVLPQCPWHQSSSWKRWTAPPSRYAGTSQRAAPLICRATNFHIMRRVSQRDPRPKSPHTSASTPSEDWVSTWHRTTDCQVKMCVYV